MIRALNLFRSRVTAAQSLLRYGSNAAVQKRFLSIHEHLSMGLLNKYGINTPKFLTAKDADEAYHAAQKFGGKPVVVKAQVLAGGRGKGHFDNGLQGGVHLVKTYVQLGMCTDIQSRGGPRFCQQDDWQQAYHKADGRWWPSLQRGHDRRGPYS